MTINAPEYLPRDIDRYVPAAAYSADVDIGTGMYSVSLGTPALADTDAILAGQSIATAGAVAYGDEALLSDEADATYGRNITVVASGAATSTVTVEGRDYLGQKMKETMTLNGASAVNSVKAFKHLDNVSFGATAATTIDMGWGAKLGLPYKTNKVSHELASDAAASAGTLVAGVTTDPATATTGDPRGLYTATTTLDGVKEIVIIAFASKEVNSSGNGGLYGIKHYFA